MGSEVTRTRKACKAATKGLPQEGPLRQRIHISRRCSSSSPWSAGRWGPGRRGPGRWAEMGRTEVSAGKPPNRSRRGREAGGKPEEAGGPPEGRGAHRRRGTGRRMLGRRVESARSQRKEQGRKGAGAKMRAALREREGGRRRRGRRGGRARKRWSCWEGKWKAFVCGWGVTEQHSRGSEGMRYARTLLYDARTCLCTP